QIATGVAPGYLRTLAFSPDGRRLAAGDDNGAQIWDRARKAALSRVESSRPEPLTAMAFVGDRLLATDASGAIEFLAPRGEARGPFVRSLSPGLVLARDGRRMAVVQRGSVSIWDPSVPERLLDVPTTSSPTGAALSQDGRR